MKTWIHVERRLERMHLPYRVQDETLVTLDGRTVAVSVQGARDRFASPGHPDSKRQARCKQRSLTRYGARVLKESGVTSCPHIRINKRREHRNARDRMAQERKHLAACIAARLLGNGRTLPGWTSVDGVRYGR